MGSFFYFVKDLNKSLIPINLLIDRNKIFVDLIKFDCQLYPIVISIKTCHRNETKSNVVFDLS
jgi:hypothetical protein